MSQHAVLDPRTDLPIDGGRSAAVLLAPAPDALDPVLTLVEAFERADAANPGWPTNPVKPAFDAQYWACWVVAVAYPLLVAYLCLTR